MLVPETARSGENSRSHQGRPHILVGVTSAQTCVVLQARVKALRDAGFRVSVLSGPGQQLDQIARTEQVSVFSVAMKRGISPLRDVVALVRIWRLIRLLRPDIVEFSTPKARLLGILAARFCGIRARIYVLKGLRLETAQGFRRRLLGWAERIAAGSAHRVVCNSPSLRERALAMRMGSPSKVILLGKGSSNGVDLARFVPGASDVRKQLGIEHGAPVIGFSGRLTADKGLPELLEAFAVILHDIPDAYLLLVGWFDAAEDALQSRIRARIEGHPRIICTGFVYDTAAYYRVMDLMVLPSWREGFPNAVLEAAASGVPVIATRCTGSRDAVIPDVTGLLVPVGRPEAICDAVLNLMGNPDRRRGMSAAARAWVAENYADRKVLSLAVDFYLNLGRAGTAQALHAAGKKLPEPVTELAASL
jgi:glycosyltransferase involved in cell wall biosynthesis